jgi:hypothetical protein
MLSGGGVNELSNQDRDNASDVDPNEEEHKDELIGRPRDIAKA